MWFELIISARTFYMVSLPEKDAKEDHGDAGLATSSNGLEYPSQSVFSSQRTEARGEPWCPCQRPPTLSHEDGPGQGKARSTPRKKERSGGQLVQLKMIGGSTLQSVLVTISSGTCVNTFLVLTK